MDIDLSQYMDLYVDNSRENLDVMDRMLLALEQNSQNLEAIQEIFRAAHTLKGMSATMGFEKVAQLTHKMENILELLRGKKIAINSKVIDLLFETFDVLRILVNDTITASDSNIDLETIFQKLSALSEGGGEGEAQHAKNFDPQTYPQSSSLDISNQSEVVSTNLSEMGLSEFEVETLLEACQKGSSAFQVEVILVKDCLLKGPRVFMVLRNLDSLHCEIVKSNPPVKTLEEEKFDNSFKMVVTTTSQPNEIKGSLEGISEVETVEVLSVYSSEIKQSSISSVSESPASKTVQPARQAEPPISHQPKVNETNPEKPVSPVSPTSQTPKPISAMQVSSPRSLPSQPVEQTLSTPVSPSSPSQSSSNQAVGKTPSPSAESPAGSIQTAGVQIESDLEKEKERKDRELVHLVSFYTAGETYAIDIILVESIINLLPITRVPKAAIYIEGVINMRGEVIPVISLRRRLKLDEKARAPEDQIIILHFEEHKVKVGLLVDNVKEVLRLKKESIEPPSHVSEGVNIEYLKGVGKIDKKLIILLNANNIIFGTPTSAKKGKGVEDFLP